MTRLVVLRPEPGASATLGRARELGLNAVAIPLFEIQPLAWKTPERSAFDGLLLTSANAVRMGGDQLKSLRGLPAYAVGQETAAAARDAGFDIAATGDEGIDRLVGSIDAELRLLHLCGVERREPSDARQSITPLPVYRATAIERPDLRSVEGAVALVHSPRAGRRLAELVGDRRSTVIAAISDAAAKTCGTGWQAIAVADRPADDALLALAARLCNNSGQR